MSTPLPRTLLPLLLPALLALVVGCPATFEPEQARGVLKVLVDPARPVVPVGGETALTATALTADGSAEDVTAEVEWTVFSGGQFVAINGEISGDIRLFGLDEGHAQLFAVLGEVVSEVVVVEVAAEPPQPGDGHYPDLEILGFDATVDGGETRYAVDVVNDGDAVSGGFWVDLYRDRDDAPGAWDVGDEYRWVEELAPGEVAYLDFVIPATPSPVWHSYAVVDGDQRIDEHHEADNLAGPLGVEG